jgi:hypothetical protein
MRSEDDVWKADAMMGERARPARLGAACALAVSGAAAVRMIAIDNAVALVILIPAVVGGLLGLWRPAARFALAAAAVLVAATMAVSLIGYWGLLFLPSVVLLLVAASRPSHAQPEARSPRP